MLISKYVEITLDNRNFLKLKNKYNISDIFKIGDLYKISLDDLMKQKMLPDDLDKQSE